MENVSKTLRWVIDYYGFNCEGNGRTVCVSSPNGEIVFRLINNMRYRVYGYVNRQLSVNRLIGYLEDVL